MAPPVSVGIAQHAAGPVEVVVDHAVERHRAGVEHASAGIGLEARGSLAGDVGHPGGGGHVDDARQDEQEVDIAGDAVDTPGDELAGQQGGPVGLARGQPHRGAHRGDRWDALGRAELFVGSCLARDRDQVADEQRVHRTQLVEHGLHVGFAELEADALGARDQLGRRRSRRRWPARTSRVVKPRRTRRGPSRIPRRPRRAPGAGVVLPRCRGIPTRW